MICSRLISNSTTRSCIGLQQLRNINSVRRAATHFSSQHLRFFGSALRIDVQQQEEKKWWLRMLGFYSKDTLTTSQADILVKSCRGQSSNPEFYSRIGLVRNFQTEFMVSGLHMWMIWNRLREFGSPGRRLGTAMFDYFWEEITKDIIGKGVPYVNVNKNLTELQHMFFGQGAKLDQGVKQNDANLIIESLKKNVFLGEQAGTTGATLLFEYMMQSMNELEKLREDEIFRAKLTWGLPQTTPKKD